MHGVRRGGGAVKTPVTYERFVAISPVSNLHISDIANPFWLHHWILQEMGSMTFS